MQPLAFFFLTRRGVTLANWTILFSFATCTILCDGLIAMCEPSHIFMLPSLINNAKLLASSDGVPAILSAPRASCSVAEWIACGTGDSTRNA